MITFSKRYKKEFRRYFRRDEILNVQKINQSNTQNFLNSELRNRIQSEIQFIIKNNFLENFLKVTDKNRNIVYLHKETFYELGNRELGIDLTFVIDPFTLSFSQKDYTDYRLFDLIEILIVFCKTEKTDEFIKRLNYIFSEFEDEFVVYNNMIYSKKKTGLQSIVSLIKDDTLKNKLESISSMNAQDFDYQTKAKISAEIIQYLFSSNNAQGKTKEVAEKIIRDVSKRITSSLKTKELSNDLNDLVLIAKKLSNKINDIRHTDRHTIPVENPDIYKLIFHINFNIAELVILSTPDSYVLNQKISEIKKAYMDRYNINKDIEWVVGNDDEDIINPDDLPF